MEAFEKPVFDGVRYKNPKSFTNWSGLPGIIGMFKWIFLEKDYSKIPSNDVLDKTLPVRKPEFNLESNLSATWLGHSTVFVHLNGISFITDPVWARRVSPFKWFGARRYRKPPCSIEELPTLNFAVISHNHYDHLDKAAVKRLSERFPDMEWFVPVGLGEWMQKFVNTNVVHELNWGEHKTVLFGDSKYQIWCVPAQHWTQRGLCDRNKSLWSGWVVLGPDRRFYYAGDTGFCDKEFEKIGTNFGRFDLSVIPIGCYLPRWFMKSQHINPEEAVQIHKMVSSKSLGVHWGTYAMGSNEAYLDPRARLREEIEKASVRPIDFFTLGEFFSFQGVQADHGETWIEDPNEPSASAPSEASSNIE